MIIIIIIIMYFNSKVSGKYWAIVSSKLSKPPGDPDYRESTIYIYIYIYIFQTVCICTNDSDISVLFNDAVNCKGYTALAVDKDKNMEHWWNDTDRGRNEVLRQRLPLVSLSPP